MKKILLVSLIILCCVSAYLLYDHLKIEPEKINITIPDSEIPDEPDDDIEIITKKSETLEKRYSKLPYDYPEFPKTDVSANFKLEVHSKFVDWVENNIPAEKNAEFATWDEDIMPKSDDEISFYKTWSTPANIELPGNWKLSTDEKKSCVLYLIFPPYENDLLQEYWVKFVLHIGSEGRIFTYALRNTERSGFIWKFAGQSVE